MLQVTYTFCTLGIQTIYAAHVVVDATNIGVGLAHSLSHSPSHYAASS